MASARIWSPPRRVSVESTTDMPAMVNVTPTERPAVASLVLPDGRERTYLFFRQGNDSSDRGLYYSWRNEVPGGRFADTGEAGFVGPCRLGDAETLYSPAAAGRDGVLYVAWSQPTAEEGVGLLNGLRLQAENTASSGCGDEWDDYPPGFHPSTGDEDPGTVERLIKGSPALALWRPERKREISGGPEEIIRCLPVPGLPAPPVNFINFPEQTFDFNFCNLFPRPDSPPIPLPDPLTQRLKDLILPRLNSDPVRAIPSVLDPMAPPRQLKGTPIYHQYSIDSMLRTDSKFADSFNKFMEQVSLIDSQGNDFSTSDITPISSSFIPNPSAPSNIRHWIGSRYILPNGLPEITFGRSEERLILAFRDTNDTLRVVDYSDNRPTNHDGDPVIPRVAPRINATDPALVSIPMGRGLEYLTVVYGVRHNDHPTGFAYRTLLDTNSRGGFTAGRFLPQSRLDQFRNLVHTRRVSDYAYLRSLNTPAIVAGLRQLHMFTAELDQTTPAEGVVTDPGYDPFPDVGGRRRNTSDHIRYTFLTMSLEGVLRPESERPVRLTNSKVSEGFETSQAGAAQITQHRSQIRFFWPNGSELTLRSRPIR